MRESKPTVSCRSRTPPRRESRPARRFPATWTGHPVVRHLSPAGRDGGARPPARGHRWRTGDRSACAWARGMDVPSAPLHGGHARAARTWNPRLSRAGLGRWAAGPARSTSPGTGDFPAAKRPALGALPVGGACHAAGGGRREGVHHRAGRPLRPSSPQLESRGSGRGAPVAPAGPRSGARDRPQERRSGRWSGGCVQYRATVAASSRAGLGSRAGTGAHASRRLPRRHPCQPMVPERA